MKKLNALTLAAAGVLVLGGLVGCGGDKVAEEVLEENYEGTLRIAGPAEHQEWLTARSVAYNEARVAAGKKALEFVFSDIGEDVIDSKVVDWTDAAVAPDVFGYAGDKIVTLNQKRALAPIGGQFRRHIQNTMTSGAVGAAQFAGQFLGYPYAADNGYYVMYDKRAFEGNEAVLENMTELLDFAASKGKNIGYNLDTTFYSAAALSTFGAKFKVNTNEQGAITSIDADYNTDKGLKAAKALQEIMFNKGFFNGQAAPNQETNTIAVINGPWGIADYEKAIGKENLGFHILPKVTVDGETNVLHSFAGFKLYGVNGSIADTERLLAAHDFAMFLTTEESGLSRYNEFHIAPTNKNLLNNETIKNDISVKTFAEQAAYSVPQTAMPGNIWSAPTTLTDAIKKAAAATPATKLTDEQLTELLEQVNTSIKTIK